VRWPDCRTLTKSRGSARRNFHRYQVRCITALRLGVSASCGQQLSSTGAGAGSTWDDESNLARQCVWLSTLYFLHQLKEPKAPSAAHQQRCSPQGWLAIGKARLKVYSLSMQNAASPGRKKLISRQYPKLPRYTAKGSKPSNRQRGYVPPSHCPLLSISKGIAESTGV